MDASTGYTNPNGNTTVALRSTLIAIFTAFLAVCAGCGSGSGAMPEVTALFDAP